MGFKIILGVVVLILVFVGLLFAVRDGGKEGWHDFSIDHEGLERTYRVYVPSSYDPDIGSWPVVLNFHGGFGNAEAAERQTAMSLTAEEKGFILVYPEAVVGERSESGKNYRHWNGGPRVDANKAPNVDDVGFVSELLDDLEGKFNVDSTKVYATGISNGGTMVYRLACELSDKISAIAPVGTNQLEIDCNPGRAVPVMHLHGVEDGFFPYEGGAGEISDSLQPVEETILEWVDRNGCSDEFNELEGFGECRVYSGCDQGARVVLCLIEGHGHTWPGPGIYAGARTCESNPDGNLCNILKGITGPRNYDFQANALMWDFFENS
ncbi:MAG: PHB depolymerase family esterase [archaeon]